MTALESMKNVGSEVNDEHLSAKTPPGVAYWDEAIFRKEHDRFFNRNWMCVGRAEEVAEPGDFVTREIGNESVLLIQGADGVPRAFYNVCRHRGTRIVDEPVGKKLRSVVCRYHAWTYSTEGTLVGAPHTDELVDFRREDFGLHPVRMETWGGFLWINLREDAPPLRETLGPFLERFDRFPLRELRLGAKKVYEVKANWKIIIENYSEWYHCAPIHPDLNRITHYLAGDNDVYFARGEERSMFAGGWQTFNGDFTSMVWSGYTRRPPLKGMTPEDRRRIYYYVVFPNLFISLHPDYLMVHTVWPRSPSQSRIECEWYFDPEVIIRPEFDPSDAVDLWDLINRQDWSVCEDTQRGVMSKAWNGGRYSSQEDLVHDFDKFFWERLNASP